MFELDYKNIFDWFLHLKLIVASSEYANIPNGNVYVDENDLSLYGKDKILFGTILIRNSLENENLKGTLYYELHHYYSKYMTYKSNSRFIKNDFDIRMSCQYNDYFNFENFDNIIENIQTSDNLRKFIYNCFYYLNQNEMEARQENIFNELKESNYSVIINLYPKYIENSAIFNRT